MRIRTLVVIAWLACGAFAFPEAAWAVGTSGDPASAQDTDEVLVFLKPGTDAQQFARDHGLVVSSALQSTPDAWLFKAGSVDEARSAASGVLGDARATSASVNRRTQYIIQSFVPNDPYFHRDTPASGWHGEWHLLNEYTLGLDARVQGAWNRDLTGQGVVIGIVDDSLQINHPDLAPNYDAADSWDFGQNDSNPSPVNSNDNHGTAVAGLAAARGGNGIGITGAAPFAGLAGLRVDFPSQTTQMFVDATLYHSSGSNTSIKVKNHSYGVTNVTYEASAPEASAFATSAAAGTIHVIAAGNDRGNKGEDSNKKEDQHGPNVIAVAAMGSDGKFASYSSFGACVFVTAPSNSATGFNGTLTTDRTGTTGYNNTALTDTFPDTDYTSRFGGTSSASPVVAGVMALGVQVRPTMDVRFAKHLLALTSTVVDAGDATDTSDGGWKTNAAGYRFNQNYGFGLVNADNFTRAAADYTAVSPLQTEAVALTGVNASIPDANVTGISRTFTLSSTTPLEEMLVTLDIAHAHRGDLEAYLTSPGGTTGRLMIRESSDSGVNIDWTFTSNTFWGEDPAGQWTLMVRDVFSGTTGTWSDYAVTARMGQLESVPEPATLAAFSLGALLLARCRRRSKRA